MRKSIWRICLLIGILGALGVYWFVYSRIGGNIIVMSQTVYGQAMLTLTFMMMGVEARREQRLNYLDDILATYPSPPWIIPLSQIAALAIVAGAITIIIEVGCLIPLVIEGVPTLWLSKVALHIILLYFLPCLALGTWGLLISHLVPRKEVYLPAILGWLSTSSLSIYFSGSITRYVDGWRLLTEFFNMGFNNFQMIPNLLTGPPIELPRWIVRAAIGAFLIAIYLAVYRGSRVSTQSALRRARVRLCALLVSGVAILACLCFRYSVFFLRFANDDLTQFYTELAGWEYIPNRPTSLADYPTEKLITLKETEINLTCATTGMEAEVTLGATMDREANAQSFTLFSGLIVDEVLVDGETACYERSHDGIVVYFPKHISAGEEVIFTFTYHGYGLPDYPVNETTVQLNNFFPWLPWPGIKTVSETEVSRYNMTRVFFVGDWQMGDSVQYRLNYKGPGNIYTNLKETGKGTFEGISSNGVALYSGMLHTNYRGVDSYVPASLYRYRYASIDAVLDSYDMLLYYCQLMEVPIIPEKPESVIVVQMKEPVWGKCVFSPNELVSYNKHWEIRQYGENSSVIQKRIQALSIEEYQSDLIAVSRTVVPYLLNPCSGYPVDVPSDATDCFSDFMTLFISITELDENVIKHYATMIYEYYGKDNGISELQINEIVEQMQAGRDFTESLRVVYRQLLQSKAITPAEIICTLHSNLED